MFRKMFDPKAWKGLYEAVSPIDLFNASQRGKLADFYKTNGLQATAKEMFKGYFAGAENQFNTGLGGGRAADILASRRRAVAGVGGGLLLSNLIAPDSFISGTANLAAAGVMHSAIGGALYGMKPGLGIGYGAWAGLNLLKTGNNIGPF